MIIKHRFMAWYFSKIKYRKFPKKVRAILTALEFGIVARKELDDLIPTMLRLNILRVIALYEDDLDRVNFIDEHIQTIQTDYDRTFKELEMMDGRLWREVFVDFILRNDNETCQSVWKVEPAVCDDIRAQLKKS